jgi:fatty-acyl-CoA synthase
MSEGVRRPVNGQSLVRGTTDVPLSDDTVHQMLAHAAARWPQRDAAVFVEQGVRWTWAGLLAEVERAGRPGRHLVAQPCEWLVTQFATARIGAMLVNINPAYRLPSWNTR